MCAHWLSRYQIEFYKPVPILRAPYWLSRYQIEFYKPVLILCAHIACRDIRESFINRYRYYARSLPV